MTVKELIEVLQTLPPDAEIYFNDGPHQGRSAPEEIDPSPQLESDGRVQL